MCGKCVSLLDSTHVQKPPTILYMTQNGVLQLPAYVQPNKSALQSDRCQLKAPIFLEPLEQPFMAIELHDGDFQQDSAPAYHFC